MAGRWSIGGGDAAAGADGSCQQHLQDCGPTRVYGRKLAHVRVFLLEHLVAARRSAHELEAALAELDSRGYGRFPFLW